VIARTFSASTTLKKKKNDEPAAVDTKKASSQSPSESQQVKQEEAKNKLKMLLKSMNKACILSPTCLSRYSKLKFFF